MNYFVIENFINPQDCKDLINDAKKFTNNKNFFKYHGNREDLTSSSLAHNQLLLDSMNWKNFANKINSREFFEMCCDKLGVDSGKFQIKNHFNISSPTRNQKIYKMMSALKINLIPSKSLLKYLAYRIYRDLIRKIKFSNLFNISKKPIELLYSYSKAGNGYKREIHRDSDSRLIVCVLYLNELPETGEGGSFDIYKRVKEDKNLAQPSNTSCEKIESIKPGVGKLIIFLNEDSSYHAVSEMKNYEGFRYFIYGSFTLLADKNNLIKNKSSLSTDYHNYE